MLEQVKTMESRGFQYEEAEASFELLVHRAQSSYKPPFELVDFMVVVESRRRPAAGGGEVLAEATVKVRVGDEVIHTAAEGDGPVNALDAALRKALTWFYPEVARVQADGLQGPHPRRERRHGVPGQGADRIRGRTAPVAHRRQLGEHHRGQLAGPGRQPGVLAPPEGLRLVPAIRDHQRRLRPTMPDGSPPSSTARAGPAPPDCDAGRVPAIAASSKSPAGFPQGVETEM